MVCTKTVRSRYRTEREHCPVLNSMSMSSSVKMSNIKTNMVNAIAAMEDAAPRIDKLLSSLEGTFSSTDLL